MLNILSTPIRNVISVTKTPHPFETKIKRFLQRAKAIKNLKTTEITKDFYLDLIEPFIRQAVNWQDSQGHIVDPL